MSKRTHEDRKKAEVDAPVFKVPNKEMIVTRGKSTQMRRQLRSKDGNPKASSSPTPPQKVAKLTAKAVPKSPPAKPSLPAEKSSKTVKKVILKPPQKLRKVEPNRAEKKVVNKRKATRPQKQPLPIELKRAKDSSPKSKAAASKTSGSKSGEEVASPSLKQRYLEDKRREDMGFAELIRLREQTEELTDEDLLEIVMCPSPVWWEDPCDDQYDKDHIFVRSSAHADTKTKAAVADAKIYHSNKCQSEEQSTLKVSRIPDSKYDQGFNKKRFALENVLCGIVTKVGKSNEKLLNQSCTPLKAKNHTLDKVVPKDTSQECLKLNTINNEKIDILEKSIDPNDKDVELVEVSFSKLSSKNTYNQATSTSDTAKEILKKMHAHLPKIRNVTADCMKRIEKGKPFQVKRVYSGNDSAELIPTKSKSRLDIFIDLSDDADVDRNCSDVKVPTTVSHEPAPVNNPGNSAQSESVVTLSNSTDEDDVLKDLENLVIPIALPIESLECIVIDEDEEKVHCDKKEPFLGVRESAETQPVRCSNKTVIDVDSDSENAKEVSSTSSPERDSKIQQETGSTEVLFVSHETTKPLSNIALRKNCEDDSKNPEKKNIILDNVKHTLVKDSNGTDVRKFSLKSDREIDSNSLSLGKLSDIKSNTNIHFSHEDRLLDDTKKNSPKTCPPKVIERDPKLMTTNNTCVTVKRSSVHSKIQQAYRDLIARIVNKRNALKENVTKEKVSQECSESQTATTSKQELVILNSSVDSIKHSDELVAKTSEAKATVQVFSSLETVPDEHVTCEVVTSETTLLESFTQYTSEEYLDENEQLQNRNTTLLESLKQDTVSTEEYLDENEQFKNPNTTLLESLKQDTVSTEEYLDENEQFKNPNTTLLESLKQDTVSTEEYLDENEQFKNPNTTLMESLKQDTLSSEENLDAAKSDYDQEGESDEQDCEYEQISEIPMTKEMIENIIGVQEAKENASDAETLEKNGFSSKCEPSKQNIVIAHSGNVKYCFNCSSIYDTDECRYCQRKSNTSKQLDKVFACRKCSYRSMKRSNMEAHALTHTKEKPFSCDRCKTSFKTKATLKNHLSKYCCSGSNRNTREHTPQSDDAYKLQYAKVSTEEKMIADGNEIIVILAES